MKTVYPTINTVCTQEWYKQKCVRAYMYENSVGQDQSVHLKDIIRVFPARLQILQNGLTDSSSPNKAGYISRVERKTGVSQMVVFPQT